MTIKQRLLTLDRLIRLRDQKQRVIDARMVRASQALEQNRVDQRALSSQIDEASGAHDAIVDLMFRHLDRMTRAESELQAEVTRLSKARDEERQKAEAANRAQAETEKAYQADLERKSLIEIIERVGRPKASSFR